MSATKCKKIQSGQDDHELPIKRQSKCERSVTHVKSYWTNNVKIFRERSNRYIFNPLTLTIMVLNAGEVIIGSKYIGQCPAQPSIPTCLLALGLAGLIIRGLDVLQKCLSISNALRIFVAYMYSGELLLFVLETYFVMSIKEPSYDNKDGYMYCDKYLYSFAYYMVYTVWILIPIILIAILIVAIYVFFAACCTPDVEEDEEEKKQPKYV